MVHYMLIRVPEKCLLAGEGDKTIYEEIMTEKLTNLIKKKKKNSDKEKNLKISQRKKAHDVQVKKVRMRADFINNTREKTTVEYL